MDVAEVWRHATELVEHVRAGNGPALLELLTYRFCGHSKNDARVYRTRAEEAQWAERDCLKLTREWLASHGVAGPDLDGVAATVQAEIADLVARAMACPPGDRAHATGGVYA
jgi:pyruvate dehydrogenase E1 component alpha subunit